MLSSLKALALSKRFSTLNDDSNDSLLEALAKAFINGEQANEEQLAKQWAASREVQIAQDEGIVSTSQIEEVEPEPEEETEIDILETTAKIIGNSFVQTTLFRQRDPERPTWEEMRAKVTRRKIKTQKPVDELPLFSLAA